MAFGFETILDVVGIGAQVFGTVTEIQGIQAKSEASEAVYRFNAAESRRKAERVRKVGAEGEFQLRIELRRQLARNRVATAAAGVMMVGSPLEAELLNIRDAASSIATLEENVRLKAMGLERLAEFQIRQSKDIKKAGKIEEKSALISGIGGVVGTVLGGPVGGAIGSFLGGLF